MLADFQLDINSERTGLDPVGIILITQLNMLVVFLAL